MKFYDLVYVDGRRFSPNCWRTTFALAHKGLEAETVPVRISEKEPIAFASSTTLPVIEDDGRAVADSWTIAEYLEDHYPERPSLFDGAVGRGACRFFNAWADTRVMPMVFQTVAPDLIKCFNEEDQAYFRPRREQRFGKTFEEMKAHRETTLAELRSRLTPAGRLLEAQPYFGGASPGYADFILGAIAQWARCASPVDILHADDQALRDWRERMLDAFGGLGRAMPAHPDAK